MPDDPRPQDAAPSEPAASELQRDGEAYGVVVLGMSRSGTSAVSEAFVRSGFFVGRDRDVMPPREENPRGYWENVAIYEANEAVLAALDASWFDPPSRERIKGSAHLAADLRSAFDRLIELGGAAPVVLKDPRIGILLDLWGPVIEGRLHPVLVVRPPTEVAASLATRSGTPRALGLAEWEVHMTGVLDYLRGRTVTVAPYHVLLDDPAQAAVIVNAAASHIEAGRRAVVDAAEAPTVMVADLRRHRPDPGELGECLTATQARLWRIVGDLPPGDQVIALPDDFTGSPSETAVEAVGDETRRVADQRVASDRGIQIAGLSAARDEAAAERDAIAAERDRIAGELAGERAVVAELRAELGRAVYQVDERARHRAERDAMAAERDAIRIARDAIAAEGDAVAAELGRRSAGV